MAHPWLSALIPTYNGESYLRLALDSIVYQEDPNIECVVVDDGSTDQTLYILEQYKDKLNIIVIEQGRKGNWVTSTNHALNLAHGEYVCILHQDDVWYKNRLKVIHSLIEAFPKVEFFLHPADFIDTFGRYLGHWHCPLPAHPSIIDSEFMLERLLTQNFIAIPSPIIKREAAIAVGGLDENLWYTADWDFWLKMALHSQVVYHVKPLCGFRIHSNSQTKTRSVYLSEFREQLKIVPQRYFDYFNGTKSQADEIRKTSAFSIEVNVALAGVVHGKKIGVLGLIKDLLKLGPAGIHRYLRDSRIWERAIARLKAQLVFGK